MLNNNGNFMFISQSDISEVLKRSDSNLPPITGETTTLVVAKEDRVSFNNYCQFRDLNKYAVIEGTKETKEEAMSRLEQKFNFFFNALNMLAITALNENAIRTADLIYDLSDLVRWSFKNEESVCTLKEEFFHVGCYVHIQKARFKELIDVKINIDPMVDDFIVPALTILPLVESSVINGIENCENKVFIVIEAKMEGRSVIINVTDSGGVMYGSTSDIIKNDNISGLGLKNVQERLELFFGTDFTFNIECKPNNSTIISMGFPVRGD